MEKALLDNMLDCNDNYIITKDMAIIYFYKLLVPEVYTTNVEIVNELQEKYNKILLSAPELTYLRFYTITKDEKNNLIDFDENILHTHYLNHFKDRLKKNIYIYFTIQFNYSIQANSFLEIKNNIEAFENQTLNLLTDNLGSITKLNRDQIFNFINLYFFSNEDTKIQTSANKNEYSNIDIGINEKIYSFSLDNYLQLENELISIYFDDNNGLANSINDIFGILHKKETIQVLTCYIENKKKRTANMHKNANLYRQISGFFNKNLYIKEADKLEELISDLNSNTNDKRIIQMNYTIFIKTNNVLDLNTFIGQLNNVGIKLKFANKVNYNSLLYYELCPNNKIFSLSNYLTPVYSSVACIFMPTAINYQTDNNGIYLCDRFNNPILLDIWDEYKKRIDARNFMILAPTGSGKSFFAQHMVSSRLEIGDICIIIDIGKSFYKFAELYKETSIYIEYQEGINFGINPFNVSFEQLKSTTYLEHLCSFFLAHLSYADESNGFFIKKSIIEYIEINNYTNLYVVDYFEFFCVNKEKLKDKYKESFSLINYDKLFVCFNEFRRGQQYYFLYNDALKIDYSFENKKLIVFEIEQAISNPIITNILINLITYCIDIFILKDTSKKGFIIYDEFAKTKDLPNILTQVAFLYQTVRKKEGSIGIILQNLNQLPINDLTASIISNTPIFYVFKNNQGYKDFLDRIHFKNQDITLQMLNSLNFNDSTSNNYYYKEVYIRIGNFEKVYRVEVSKFQAIAFSTDGSLNKLIMDEYKHNKETNLIDIINNHI